MPKVNRSDWSKRAMVRGVWPRRDAHMTLPVQTRYNAVHALVQSSARPSSTLQLPRSVPPLIPHPKLPSTSRREQKKTRALTRTRLNITVPNRGKMLDLFGAEQLTGVVSCEIVLQTQDGDPCCLSGTKFLAFSISQFIYPQWRPNVVACPLRPDKLFRHIAPPQAENLLFERGHRGNGEMSVTD